LVPPINRYLLGTDLPMAKNTRVSAGIDQAITSKVRIGTTYAHINGSGVLRGLNLNAPVNGIRPNPAFGNIIEVVGDAKSRQNTLNTFLQVSILPPSPNPGKERWNWKRTSFGLNYQLGKLENNADGAFAVPATGSLAEEWGPASSDVRHRFNMFFFTQALRNANVNFHLNMASAPPYTILTGRDNNGDLIFNNRPDGVGRNSARGDASFNLNGNFNYVFMFGKRKIQLPPGIMINGGPGGFNVTQMQIDPLPRFRLNLFVNAQNLTNHPNYVGFSGTLTSPFYGRATTVQGMRKIDVGMGFSF
jgi:hypothetical protein